MGINLILCMKLFCLGGCIAFIISFLPLQAQQQQQLLACDKADSPSFLAPPISKIETFYQKIINQKGINERYRASELALQKYGCDQEEYSAKLYNLLAEEAFLMRAYEDAKSYYDRVLATEFVPDYYAQGIIADKAKLTALVGLRNIAMQEKDYGTALHFHQRYIDSLEKDWQSVARQNQLANDKIFATCYQYLGKSEQAIQYLTPYAFGRVNYNYGAIDKEAIDYLTGLLRTKYPKKEYKQWVKTVANHIYSESKGDRVVFYLKVFENKIYFQNDSANFEYRVAARETLEGEAIAHYQRKLLNSYFYQSLLRAN